MAVTKIWLSSKRYKVVLQLREVDCLSETSCRHFSGRVDTVWNLRMGNINPAPEIGSMDILQLKSPLLLFPDVSYLDLSQVQPHTAFQTLSGQKKKSVLCGFLVGSWYRTGK